MTTVPPCATTVFGVLLLRFIAHDDETGAAVWGSHTHASLTVLSQQAQWAQYSYADAIRGRPWLQLGTFHAKYHLLVHLAYMIRRHGSTGFDTQSLERYVTVFVYECGICGKWRAT